MLEFVSHKGIQNKRQSFKNTHRKISSVKTKYEKAAEFLIYEIATNFEKKQKITNTIKVEEFIKVEYINLIKKIIPINNINEKLIQSISDSNQKTLLSNILFQESNNTIFDTETAIENIKEYGKKNKHKKLLTELKKEEQNKKENIETLFNYLIEEGEQKIGKNQLN